MSRKDFCVTLLNKEMGIDPNELTRIAEYLEDFKADVESKGLDFTTEFSKMVGEHKELVKLKQEQIVLSYNKYKEVKAQVFQDAFKGSPELGIESVITTVSKRYEGKGNLFRTAGQIRNKALQYIDSALIKYPELNKRLRGSDRALTSELYQALHPSKSRPAKISPQVAELAAAIRQSHDFMFKTKNNAGYGVNYIENYIKKQIHSPKAVREMGGEAFNTLARNTWDFDRMGVSADKIDAYIDSKFRKFTTMDMGGDILTPSHKEAIQPKFVRQMEGGRSIHFKDGLAAFEYTEALGGGQNFLDDLYKGFESDAKKIAAGQHLGPNHKSSFEQLIRDAYADPNINEKQRTRLRQQEKRLRDMYKLATDRDSRPEKNIVANVGQVSRMTSDMAKLKVSLFRTLSDIPLSAGIHGGVNNTPFMTELGYSLRSMWEALPVKNAESRRWMANKLGVFLDDSVGFANARFYEESGKLGLFSKAHQKLMQFSGLPAQSHGMRVANAARGAEALAENIHLAWKDLPQSKALSRFGIGEQEWNLMRASVEEVEYRGKIRKFITPEQLAAISGSDQLSFNYGGYLSDMAEIASPSPDLRQQVWKVGSDENTVLGQLDRATMQFKSFITKQYDVMQRLHLERNGVLGLAPVIVTGTVMGYMSNQLIQLSQGRLITLPSNAEEASKQFIEALLRSGMGTLYADLLFGDFDSPWQTPASIVAGPTIGGIITDVMHTLTTMRKLPFAEDKDAALGKLSKSALRLFERNAPNLIFGGAIVNKKVFEAVNDFLNPGTSVKRQMRLEDKGIKTIF